MKFFIFIFFTIHLIAQDLPLNVSLKYHDAPYGEESDAIKPFYNDSWGFKFNNIDYVILSKVQGFSIYKIPKKGQYVRVINTSIGTKSLWGTVRYYNGYIFKGTEGGPMYIYEVGDMSQDQIIRSKTLNGRIHTINIENGKLYTAGAEKSGISNKVIQSFDLTDPYNPIELWYRESYYVHDMTVINNKMYLAEMSGFNGFNYGNGRFAIYSLDNIVLDGIKLTESSLVLRHEFIDGFTHNIYPSSDGKYVVTTEEDANFKTLNFWNISDKNNIKLNYSHNDKNRMIHHNAYIKNDFIYTASYDHGLIIYDIIDKEMPVKVAEFDTSPFDNFLTVYAGAWNVYPYLDSNLVAISDRQKGFYIVEFDQKIRAGKLKIKLIDSLTQDVVKFTKTYSNSEFLTFKKESNILTVKGTPTKMFSDTIKINKYESRIIAYTFTKNTDDSIEVKLKKLTENQQASFVSHIAFPNPFNPFTNIDFTISENAYVEIFIFNLLGQKIKTLITKDFLIGTHKISWDATNTSNKIVSSGIYFYVINAKNKNYSGKLIYIK